jgi:beta-galactosidase
MNTWENIQPGQLRSLTNGNFVLYRATFLPYDEQQKKGGVLLLKNINGKAEVYVDGKLIATKKEEASSDLSVNIPPSRGERMLTILIEGTAGKRAGLGGAVTLN